MKIYCSLWLLGILHFSNAQTFKKEDFPNPQTEFRECGRDRPSFVCDPGKILSEADAGAMDNVIAEIQDMKNCTCTDCGSGSNANKYINFAVAIVPNIEGSYGSDEEKLLATKLFAQYLRSKSWAFRSDPDCHNDVVIVLAIEQRQFQAAIGEVTMESVGEECVGGIAAGQSASLRKVDYEQSMIGTAVLTMLLNIKSELVAMTCKEKMEEEGIGNFLTDAVKSSTMGVVDLEDMSVIAYVAIGVVVLIVIALVTYKARSYRMAKRKKEEKARKRAEKKARKAARKRQVDEGQEEQDSSLQPEHVEIDQSDQATASP